jgi:2-methylisocitrate lyase-like PEP mutase family enzyme
MRRKRANVLIRIEERMKRIEAQAKARRREELRNAAKSETAALGETKKDTTVRIARARQCLPNSQNVT